MVRRYHPRTFIAHPRPQALAARAQVFGIVGKPVAHSRSPALHNAAFAAAGVDAVYIPLLTDDLPRMLAAFGPPAFPDSGFAGFSVTIPHKARGALTAPAVLGILTARAWCPPRCAGRAGMTACTWLFVK
jgi:hypothetical protein